MPSSLSFTSISSASLLVIAIRESCDLARTEQVGSSRAASRTLGWRIETERFRVEEADGPAAVPVLREYMREIRVTRPYFNASPDSTDDDVAAELPRHPVFRLILMSSGRRQTDAAT